MDEFGQFWWPKNRLIKNEHLTLSLYGRHKLTT